MILREAYSFRADIEWMIILQRTFFVIPERFCRESRFFKQMRKIKTLDSGLRHAGMTAFLIRFGKVSGCSNKED